MGSFIPCRLTASGRRQQQLLASSSSRFGGLSGAWHSRRCDADQTRTRTAPCTSSGLPQDRPRPSVARSSGCCCSSQVDVARDVELARKVSPDGRVLSGIFEGMTMPLEVSWGGLSARVAGSYEEELVPDLAALIAAGRRSSSMPVRPRATTPGWPERYRRVPYTRSTSAATHGEFADWLRRGMAFATSMCAAESIRDSCALSSFRTPSFWQTWKAMRRSSSSQVVCLICVGQRSSLSSTSGSLLAQRRSSSIASPPVTT